MIRLAILFFALALFALAATFLIDRFQLFPQWSIIGVTLQTTTVILFGAAGVFCAGFAIVEITMVGLMQTYPSAMARSIILMLLTFGASTVVLAQVGVDVGGLLTTSAVLGGILGLALQPTLGNIFAGLALSSGGTLRVGSGIIVDNEFMEVEELHWRHVIARKSDNILVILPNTVLAGAELQILAEDRPTSFDTFIDLPSEIPPQKVTDLLSGSYTDMVHLDSTQPFMVAPFETRPRDGALRYRIRCFARYYMQIPELRGEIIRRAWYVLERNGIDFPSNRLYRNPSRKHVVPTSYFSAKGRIFRFAPDEMIGFSTDENGVEFLVIHGHLIPDNSTVLHPIEFGNSSRPYLSRLPVEILHDKAKVRKIADEFANYLGPAAEKVVAETQRRCSSLEELVGQLAQIIVDHDAKKRFLEALPDFSVPYRLGPGDRVELVRDYSNRVTTPTPLRAQGEVTVMVLYAEGS